MNSFAVCCAAANVAAGLELVDYIAKNTHRGVELAPVLSHFDFVETLESALSFDGVVGLLSTASVPAKCPRERWDALPMNRIAWVRLEDCPYPRMFERAAFFNVSDDRMMAWRNLRRWALTGQVSSELCAEPFIDQPGRFQASAPAIVSAEPYFEQTIHIDGRHRSPTSLLSEAALLLGLDRSADRESMSAALASAMRSRRILIALQGGDAGVLGDPGRCSVVAVDAAPVLAVQPERMLVTLLACTRGRAEAPPCAELDRTLSAAFAGEWAVARELGLAAHAYLRAEYRLAEDFDLLESLRRAAQFYGDLDTLNRCIVDQSWIGEQWSSRAAVLEPAHGPQLTFGW